MASKSAIPALAGAVVALLFDLLAHYEVFVHPTSSTAALALLFAPLWNTLVFSPIAILLTWQILRRRAQRHEAAP
jgi:membrane protein implicated in regulation of membrane protease activity